jgi:hypothetical protein
MNLYKERRRKMAIDNLFEDMKERAQIERLYWAGVLIWAGLVFGADAMGYLPEVGNADAWSWLFLGAGLFGTLGTIYRSISPEVLDPSAWDYIWSGFWLLVGLSGFVTTTLIWPVALVLVGVIALISVVRSN